MYYYYHRSNRPVIITTKPFSLVMLCISSIIMTNFVLSNNLPHTARVLTKLLAYVTKNKGTKNKTTLGAEE